MRHTFESGDVVPIAPVAQQGELTRSGRAKERLVIRVVIVRGLSGRERDGEQLLTGWRPATREVTVENGGVVVGLCPTLSQRHSLERCADAIQLIGGDSFLRYGRETLALECGGKAPEGRFASDPVLASSLLPKCLRP
jgi:hypothetical protein